jgi:hypothetical protein
MTGHSEDGQGNISDHFYDLDSCPGIGVSVGRAKHDITNPVIGFDRPVPTVVSQELLCGGVVCAEGVDEVCEQFIEVVARGCGNNERIRWDRIT